MSIKTIPFKKGDLVPLWILRCSVSKCYLVFLQDAVVIKFPMEIEIYPSNAANKGGFIKVNSMEVATRSENLIDFVDNRPLWLKILHKITMRVNYINGRPTKFFKEPFDFGSLTREKKDEKSEE